MAKSVAVAQNNLTMKEEDYLEAILTISEKKGYAKAKDVTLVLSISPSSASEMFVKLANKGLIIHRKYEGAVLTEAGMHAAVRVRQRHEVLARFLKSMGVADDVAEKDACFMEHGLHQETIEKIRGFVNGAGKR